MVLNWQSMAHTSILHQYVDFISYSFAVAFIPHSNIGRILHSIKPSVKIIVFQVQLILPVKDNTSFPDMPKVASLFRK